MQQRVAGKKKSVCITRAGVYLKPAPVQVAHAVVKSKDSPYYKQISKRRGRKRAIIAIARMILTAIFFMFKSGEEWNPTEYVQNRYAIGVTRKTEAKSYSKCN